jgi:hypothetical protein
MNDEFEKWWERDCPSAYRVFINKTDAQGIFKAGAAAMREAMKKKILKVIEDGAYRDHITGEFVNDTDALKEDITNII